MEIQFVVYQSVYYSALYNPRCKNSTKEILFCYIESRDCLRLSKYTDTRHWSVSSLHENKSYPTNKAEYRTCRMFWHLRGRRSIVPFPKRKQAKSGTYSTQSITKNNFSLVLKLFAMNHVYLGSSQLCPLLIF